MIGRITGELVSVTLAEVIVDVNGVGYEIIIPLSTYDKLPGEGKRIALYTALDVKENAMTLYGFASLDEKELYKILITVSGIGPKLALKILSSVSITSFCEYISAGDVKNLSRINGVGKKSAERMVVELREKIQAFVPESMYSDFGKESENATKNISEATLALVQLGFKADLSRKVVQKVAGEMESCDISSEALIKAALNSLNR